MIKNEGYFQKLSKEELRRIIKDPNANEDDIIMASVEMGHREIPEGKFCTTEEIIEYFEKYYMAGSY